MILPDFIISSCINRVTFEAELDNREKCFDIAHYDAYPHVVEYRYNSRGFRDSEWPESIEELQNAIWCVGDSCTEGAASPLEHTWVNILQRRTGIRCINISMPGASNEWIARKIKRILEEINPQYIVVHWAYLHRTESNDTRLTDEARRKEMLKDISIDNQVNNFKRIRDSINKGLTKIIESGIPSFFPIYTHKEYKQKITTFGGEDWPDLINIALEDFNLIDNWIKKELEDFEILDQVIDYLSYKHFLIEFEDIIFVEQIDLARDGKHYDVLTANNFVDSIIKVL